MAARSTAPKPNLAGLRHEILTPVNHIIGFAEMLLDDLDQPGFSSISQNLTRIREIARELASTVERTLNPLARRRIDESLEALREEITQPVHAIL